MVGSAAAACGDDGASSDGETGGTETETTPSTTEPDSTASETETTPTATESDTESGTGTESDSDTESGTDTEGDPVFIPQAGGMRRLLGHQYTKSVSYLLGPEAAAAAVPPADGSIGGFDSAAALELAVPPTGVDGYDEAAFAAAQAAIENPDTMAGHFGCITGNQGNNCYRNFAEAFGELAFRREMRSDELDALEQIAQDAQAWGSGDFMIGLKYMLIAFMQAPSFVYIVETGETDPDSGYRKLTQAELATRMSFFILGRTPDRDLLDRAANGNLDTNNQIRTVAEGMLDDPLARETLRQFYDEYYRVRGLPLAGKDADLFPVWSEALAESMREETLRLMEHIVFDSGDSYLTALDADYTFIDASLAAIYGISAPANDWDMVDLPAGEDRGGFLTTPGWLSTFAHGTKNSPVRRGLFIQEQLLCNKIPPPPPGVNPDIPDPEPNETLREALLRHQDDPTCAGCHAQLDGLGFAFENFNAIGESQTMDNGQPIDATGDITGLGTFDGVQEMVALVRDHEQFPQCTVKHIYRNGLGWIETDEQEDGLDVVTDEFVDADHDFKEALVQLSLSPLFRLVDEPK